MSDDPSCQCCVCGNLHPATEGTSTLVTQITKLEEEIEALRAQLDNAAFGVQTSGYVQVTNVKPRR